MKNKKNRFLLLAVALVALSCLSGSAALAEPFTYAHVIGTGDPTPYDPHPTEVDVDETQGIYQHRLIETPRFNDLRSWWGGLGIAGPELLPATADLLRHFYQAEEEEMGYSMMVVATLNNSNE